MPVHSETLDPWRQRRPLWSWHIARNGHDWCVKEGRRIISRHDTREEAERALRVAIAEAERLGA